MKNGNDIYVDFPDWNAKSVYFYDAEENILEFIARHNLDEPTNDATFTSNHIKRISEIGIAVSDTEGFAKKVKENTGLFSLIVYRTFFAFKIFKFGAIMAKCSKLSVTNMVYC